MSVAKFAKLYIPVLHYLCGVHMFYTLIADITLANLVYECSAAACMPSISNT